MDGSLREMTTVGALAWYRHSLHGAQPPYPGQSVPCGDCTACCQHVRVVLTPLDVPARYQTVREADGTIVLAKQDDGSCAHLLDNHCTVYPTRPLVCRQFDCRALLVTDIHTPAHIRAAADAKFAVVAKEPGDREFLAQVRAHAKDATGADPIAEAFAAYARVDLRGARSVPHTEGQ